MRDQRGLPLGNGFQQGERRDRVSLRNSGVVPRDHVVEQVAHAVDVAPACAEVFRNVPTRTWLAATRVSTAPGSNPLRYARARRLSRPPASAWSGSAGRASLR